MDDINELIKKVEALFEDKKFTEITTILTDELLKTYNNAELYAWCSRAYNKLNEYDTGFHYAQKSIDIDSNYFMGYYVRGCVWSNQKEYDKAIADYNKAIEIKNDYNDAYNNRGNAWSNQKEYDKAIADYNKTIELKNDDYDVYNNRGVAWYNQKEYDKAIADYTKAIELKNDYALAYRNRGDVFYDLENLQQSLEDYNAAVKFDEKSFGWLNNKIKLIEEKLEEIESSKKTNAKEQDKTLRAELEEANEKLIQFIRKESKSEVKTVVHYTKLFVAEIYVKAKCAKLNYSNAIYMNDPTEGKVLFDYIDDELIKQAYLNGEKRTEMSVYLGSFLPAEDNDRKISHEDELVMWRTYGKDENGKEAAGCNVVLRSDFFKIKTSSDEMSLPISDYEEELLNVIYIKKFKDKREIANDDIKGKIEPAIKKLKSNLNKLIKLRNKYNPKEDFYKDIENNIFKQLSQISYLFKSADFNYEHEVRVIKYMPRDSDDIKYRENTEPNSPQKRFYVDSYNEILPYIKKIYIGTKVENYQQWSLYFDYEIRQRIKEFKSMPVPPCQIEPKDIEICKSECKFQ